MMDSDKKARIYEIIDRFIEAKAGGRGFKLEPIDEEFEYLFYFISWYGFPEGRVKMIPPKWKDSESMQFLPMNKEEALKAERERQDMKEYCFGKATEYVQALLGDKARVVIEDPAGERRCGLCRWACLILDENREPTQCRRHSPLLYLPNDARIAIWPEVKAEQFCGDFEGRTP